MEALFVKGSVRYVFNGITIVVLGRTINQHAQCINHLAESMGLSIRALQCLVMFDVLLTNQMLLYLVELLISMLDALTF